MAHTVPNEKSNPAREAEDVEICILEPDQEQEILKRREALIQSRLKSDCGALPPALTVRKRHRAR